MGFSAGLWVRILCSHLGVGGSLISRGPGWAPIYVAEYNFERLGPCFHFPSARMITGMYNHAEHVCCWRWNPGPHACWARLYLYSLLFLETLSLVFLETRSEILSIYPRLVWGSWKASDFSLTSSGILCVPDYTCLGSFRLYFAFTFPSVRWADGGPFA